MSETPAPAPSPFGESTSRLPLMSARYGVGALGLVVLARLGAGLAVFPGIWMPGLVFLAVAGFPVALAVAWIRDQAAHGPPGSGVAASPAETPGTRHPVLRSRPLAAAVGPVCLLLAAWIGLRSGAESIVEPGIAEPPPTPRVVVLPLIDIDGGGDRYFADGLTGELVASLAAIDGLEVRGRASTATFLDVNRDAAALGRRFGGHVVLDGTVRRSSGRLRLGVRLVDAASGAVLWSMSGDTTRAELFMLRDEVARGVAEAVGIEPTDRTLRRLERRRTSVEALDLYLLGRNRAAGPRGDLLEAAAYYHLAVAADSGFAPGWVALAEAYATLPRFTRFPPERARSEGSAAARTALQLDPDNAAAHGVLGEILYLYEWDWSGARSHLERAVELDPGAAAPFERMCELLLMLGELEAAAAACAEALVRDPLAFRPAWTTAEIDRAAGDLESALARLDSLVRAHPDFEPLAADLAISRLVAADTAELTADLAHWFGLLGRAGLADSLAAALAGAWPAASEASPAGRRVLADVEAELDPAPVHLAALLTLFGDHERAAEVALSALAERTPRALGIGVFPEYAALRERDDVRRQLAEAGLAVR